MKMVYQNKFVSKETRLFLVIHVVFEFLLDNSRVATQNLDNGLGESFHVPIGHLWIGTFQLANYVVTLSELCEQVHHRIGEQRMFRTGLELSQERVYSGLFSSCLFKTYLILSILDESIALIFQ